MTYDQATIEKAARLLAQLWRVTEYQARLMIDAFFARQRQHYSRKQRYDIEFALRRAVEESK